MAEEGEIVPAGSVDEYYLVDRSDKLIQLSVLPLKWSDEDPDSYSGVSVYLRGEDSFHELAKAWKFDLTDVEGPKIQVFVQGSQWISLEKPKQSYEALIRTTLVTIQCLHYVKKNPEASSDDVWSGLQNVDGKQPSEEDLSGHVSLVCQSMIMDEDLAKSKWLISFTSQTTPPIEEALEHHQREDDEEPNAQNISVDDCLDQSDKTSSPVPQQRRIDRTTLSARQRHRIRMQARAVPLTKLRISRFPYILFRKSKRKSIYVWWDIENAPLPGGEIDTVRTNVHHFLKQRFRKLGFPARVVIRAVVGYTDSVTQNVRNYLTRDRIKLTTVHNRPRDKVLYVTDATGNQVADNEIRKRVKAWTEEQSERRRCRKQKHRDHGMIITGDFGFEKELSLLKKAGHVTLLAYTAESPHIGVQDADYRWLWREFLGLPEKPDEELRRKHKNEKRNRSRKWKRRVDWEKSQQGA